MIFQWQLFALLIVSAMIALMMGQRVQVNVYGEKQIHYTWLPVLILTIPMIYMAGTRSKTVLEFGDTSAYLESFKNATTSLTELFASFTEEGKDMTNRLIVPVIEAEKLSFDAFDIQELKKMFRLSFEHVKQLEKLVGKISDNSKGEDE